MDGVQTAEDSTGPYLGASGETYIGMWDIRPWKPFQGIIDDVRIYTRALSADEVAWLGGVTEPFDKPF